MARLVRGRAVQSSALALRQCQNETSRARGGRSTGLHACEMAGDQQNWRTCFSYYACELAEADEHDGEALSGPRDYEKAKRLIVEAAIRASALSCWIRPTFPS